MLTEYHCHILPGIDDGAENAEASLKMAEMLKEQGVERIVATPHFYAHREKSVTAFLEKRAAAHAQIKDAIAIKDVRLGAEVAIEHGISELPDIEKLAITGTRLILLELPYRGYAKWMAEEIYNIAAEYNLKVMLAHVHRYTAYYSKEELESILSMDTIFQLNNEAFGSWTEKRIAKRVIGECEHFVFGSDAHNSSSRKPNWNLLQKKVKPEVIARSDSVLEAYAK